MTQHTPMTEQEEDEFWAKLDELSQELINGTFVELDDSELPF